MVIDEIMELDPRIDTAIALKSPTGEINTLMIRMLSTTHLGKLQITGCYYYAIKNPAKQQTKVLHQIDGEEDDVFLDLLDGIMEKGYEYDSELEFPTVKVKNVVSLMEKTIETLLENAKKAPKKAVKDVFEWGRGFSPSGTMAYRPSTSSSGWSS